MPVGIYKHKSPSLETRIKMSKSRLGFKHSNESIIKMSLSKKGKKFTEEHKRNLKKARKSYKHSLETKEKIKKAHLLRKEKNGYINSIETRKKLSISMIGNKNGLKHGLKPSKKYGVDWTETLRRSIRERDNYTCQLCGKQQGDISHDVHHIDYDKLNCNPNNLITLCHNCHTKTTFKRDYWILNFEIINLIRNS